MTPGLIDCPHPSRLRRAPAGRRERFELRLEGASYAEISRQGGGIVYEPSRRQRAGQRRRVARRLAAAPRRLSARGGVTNDRDQIGLWARHGERAQDAARRPAASGAIRPGFPSAPASLGAHALPSEYAGAPGRLMSISSATRCCLRFAASGLADAGRCVLRDDRLHGQRRPARIFRRRRQARPQGQAPRRPARRSRRPPRSPRGFGRALRRPPRIHLGRRACGARWRCSGHRRGAAARRQLLPGAKKTDGRRSPPSARAGRAHGDPPANCQSRLGAGCSRSSSCCRWRRRFFPPDARGGARRHSRANAARALGLADSRACSPRGMRADLALSGTLPRPAELGPIGSAATLPARWCRAACRANPYLTEKE